RERCQQPGRWIGAGKKELAKSERRRRSVDEEIVPLDGRAHEGRGRGTPRLLGHSLGQFPLPFPPVPVRFLGYPFSLLVSKNCPLASVGRGMSSGLRPVRWP